MLILRVLNNNVVLARETSGREVIVTGRGLGFQRRPGMSVDPEKIVRVFVPEDGRDPDHLAMVLADIDQDIVRAVALAISEAQVENPESTNPTLVIAVADHIAGAVARNRRAGDAVQYPLEAEVMHLYSEEYAKAQVLLAHINRYLDEPLPDTEAIALALHIVNSGFASGDLSFTYTMTGLIHQMIAVISERYGIDVPHDSVSVARFITHVRYLFVRIRQGKQLHDAQSVVGDGIRTAFPDAVRTAEQLADIVHLRLGESLSRDEIAYLALHVARMTQDE